ncbi:MAG: transcription antitermination factor NusB [Erysipelothrix sp.]|nr:transcription antitermination factor NusB [Erysipelothrix sp.]
MIRQNERENAMIYLYQMLVKAEAKIEDILGDDGLLSDDFSGVIDNVLENIRNYRTLLDQQLIDWTFERLGFIEQAILLLALAEQKVLDTPKSVIIDEAIILSKKFSDEDSYKLVNATLDKVIQ